MKKKEVDSSSDQMDNNRKHIQQQRIDLFTKATAIYSVSFILQYRRIFFKRSNQVNVH